MLQRERRGLDEERQRLMQWGSLLKKRTTSEKEKATERRQQLNKMEVMLKQEEVTISLLDAQAQELMEKAKELYIAAEACSDANIKAQEDLNGQAIAIAQRERMVAEQELWEMEEEVADMLEHGCSELSSREADLNT
jgi:hypothetical protein